MGEKLQELIKLAPQVYQISFDHGFWEEGEKRNKAEMVALINSELYESLEGHRKGKRYPIGNNPGYNPDGYFGRNWINCFKDNVKDTVEDEIADAVIRILDYTHGWGIEVQERWYRKDSTGNYGNDLLRLNHYVLQAFHESVPGCDWGYCLAAIVSFCGWYNIDIVKHVQWKMRYNDSRPYKHNKNY